MNDVQKSTLPQTQSALPESLPEPWVEKIFQRMENFYLALWKDRFGDIPRERVKQAWAEELAGYSASEIKRGLDVCRTMKFPPTLPEFLTACRPPSNPKTDWTEACEQMRIRLKGQGGDTWSRPQVYWAAVSIGQFDLNQNTWEQIKTRWEKALADAKADEIPEYRAALPAPGQGTTTREEAAQRLHEITEKAGVTSIDHCEPNARWAVRLAEREASGEDMSILQKKMWRDALGAKMATTAKDVLAGLEKAA